MSLLDDLRAEGLTVETWPNWETHAAPMPSYVSSFAPIGILNHWDAVRGWSLNTYFNNPRFDQPTYHIAIRPDGLVALGSQGYVYGAGGGDAAVYQAMKADKVPPPAAVEKNMNGNPYFWAVCFNYYPGSKSSPPGPPLPGAQYEAGVKVNAVLCRRARWNPLYRTNDHDGWTTRKDDLSGSPPGNWWAAPSNWDLTRFRNDVRRQLEGSMPVPDYAKPAVAKAIAGGFLREGTEAQLIPRYDLMVWLNRLGALDDFHVDESGDVQRVNDRVTALHTEVANLRARVDGLQLKAGRLPAEEVVKIVRDQ